MSTDHTYQRVVHLLLLATLGIPVLNDRQARWADIAGSSRRDEGMEVVVDVGAVGVDLALDLIAPSRQLTASKRLSMMVGIVMALASAGRGFAAHS